MHHHLLRRRRAAPGNRYGRPSPRWMASSRPLAQRGALVPPRRAHSGRPATRPSERRPPGSAAPRPGVRRSLDRLAVKREVVGPHARLGVVWAVVTVAGAVAGPLWLGLWLAPLTGLAAAHAARLRSRPPRGRAMTAAGAGAAAVTLSGMGGQRALVVAAAAVVGVVAATSLSSVQAPRARAGQPLALALIALTTGLAGAAPVFLRTTGLAPVLVLLAYAMVYDASTYVVGSGAASSWEGPAAGVAATGTVTLAVAAVLVPPFEGASPWILGGLAAVTTPLGPLLGTALVGDQGVRAPALRRLDSLLLLSPLWSLAAALLLD